MSQPLTVHQVASVAAQLIGFGCLIVMLSYPLGRFSNFLQSEVSRPKPQQIAEQPAPKAESWIPAPLQSILHRDKPANTLVPPPPPLAY